MDSRAEGGSRADASARDSIDVGPSRDGPERRDWSADDALSFALARAAAAARWDVVAQLARELEARRLKGDGRECP